MTRTLDNPEKSLHVHRTIWGRPERLSLANSRPSVLFAAQGGLVQVFPNTLSRYPGGRLCCGLPGLVGCLLGPTDLLSVLLPVVWYVEGGNLLGSIETGYFRGASKS